MQAKLKNADKTSVVNGFGFESRSYSFVLINHWLPCSFPFPVKNIWTDLKWYLHLYYLKLLRSKSDLIVGLFHIPLILSKSDAVTGN